MTTPFDLGSGPTWNVCKVCGIETMRDMCFACDRRLEQQRELQEASVLAGIPSRFAWATLEASDLGSRVKCGRPLEVLTRSILEAPRVTIGGGTGTGKTSLAVACMRRALPYAMFVRAERLARAPIEHKAGSGEHPLVQRAKTTRLLLLDDLGTDEITKVSAVRDVVFDRYDAGLPTWITTGLSSSDIEALYGAGFYRRAVSEALTVGLGVKAS